MFTNLASAIEKKGLNVEKISVALGIQRKTLRKKLQGNIYFTLEDIRKLNAIFSEYSLDYLYANDQTERPKESSKSTYQ